MAEYIERQKVLDLAKTFSVDICSDEEYFLAFAYVETNDIKFIPAADVRPVVLCRDCKHWDIDWVPNYAKENEHFCPIVTLTCRRTVSTVLAITTK